MCRSACPAALARSSIYAAKRLCCGPGEERRDPTKQFYIKLFFSNTVILESSMGLSLYRRHRQQCEAARPLESRSGEFEERKKGWKRCACFIFASGTLGGKFKRKYTGKTEWDEAKSVAAAWELTDSWDGKAKPAPPLASVVDEGAAGRVSIADGIKL